MFQKQFKKPKKYTVWYLIGGLLFVAFGWSIIVAFRIKHISDRAIATFAADTAVDFVVSKCKRWQTYESTILVNAKIFGEYSYFLITGDPGNTLFRPYCDPPVVLSDTKNNPNAFQIGMIKCVFGPCEPVDAFPPARRSVICLAPLYGKQNEKWLIEWLEYHAAIGFDLIHVPVFEFSKNGRTVLEQYVKKKLVIIEDWSPETTQRISNKNYEHGKLEAWNSCMMEYVETTDWMLFIDVDDLFVPGTDLEHSLNYFEEFSKRTIGFAMHSVTTTSVFNKVRNTSLLAQYQNVEAKPLCPYNCGEYHKGRQKYMLRGGQLPEQLLWTYSIGGLDYENVGNKIMAQIPKSIASIHHYSGRWYFHHGEFHEDIKKSVYEPLPQKILNTIQIQINSQPLIKYIHKHSFNGLPWVKNHLNTPLGDM